MRDVMKRKRSGWRGKWNALMQGPMGTVLYVILGFIIAYGIHAGLATALNTDTPVVAVFSESMKHGPDQHGNACGRAVSNRLDFDEFWEACGTWYENSEISKDTFRSWDFKNGFDKGDMIFVTGNEEIRVGDVIVFNSGRGDKFPIIHRVISIEDGAYRTKGDNNPVADTWTIRSSQIYGKAVIGIPVLGWVKVGMYKVLGLEG